MGEEKTVASWLLPALIAGSVSLVGIVASITLTHKQITANQTAVKESVTAQKLIELAKLRKDILSSVDSYDFNLADLMLEFALKPLDQPESFAAFSKKYEDYVSIRVVESPKSARLAAEAVNISSEQYPLTQENDDYAELVDQFSGSDRLKNSNLLIKAYENEPNEVISALINGILVQSEISSYRVNLYIAFTLARISGGWAGTQEQLVAIKKFRETTNYHDPTFKKRTDEAIENYMVQ